MVTGNQRPDDLHPLQFRLRTALGVVTAVALFFSLVTWLKMPGWVAAGSAIFGLTIVIVWSSRRVGLYLGAIFLYLAMYGWLLVRFGWQSSGPTLWLIGSDDPYALDSLKEYEAALEGTKMQAEILDGLDHEQVFEAVERVAPLMAALRDGHG